MRNYTTEYEITRIYGTPSDDHHNFLAAHPPEVSSTEMSLTMYLVKVYLKSLYCIQYTLYIETVKLRLLLT